MRVGRGCAGALMLLALGACAPRAPPLLSPVPGVAVRRTALSRYVEIVGPERQHAPPFLGVPGTNFFVLRSWLDRRTGRATTQLYVSDSYRGPQRIWDAAYDPAGRALPFTAIDRERISCRGGCSWTEDFAAGIPERELDAAPGGLAVAFVARSGFRKTIIVTARQIRLQRAAVAAARLQVRLTIPG
jgi:hypothetical protein